MITHIDVENYKSIEKLSLDLGRINVFIGENGAGKSNVLEAIALAGATAGYKLDNEFLASRGIRVTKPELMRSNFPGDDISNPIKISVKHDLGAIESYTLENDNKQYGKWTARIRPSDLELDFDSFKSLVIGIAESIETAGSAKEKKEQAELFAALKKGFLNSLDSETKQLDTKKKTNFELPSNKTSIKFAEALFSENSKRSAAVDELSSFVIYSPENSSLRIFEKEGQIEPLGINGEGLLKLLSFYATESNDETLAKIKDSLTVLDWFADFEPLLSSSEARLLVKDRYLSANATDFDHKSTNEGFFFLLFYFALFNSALTPRFFAIDNIDASLNPKLCQKLVQELVTLAEKNNKQVILTTHNPAVLDGLNLDDDNQRLFAISRNRQGKTRFQRVRKPVTPEGRKPPKLSELFLSGAIGGLPKGF